MPEDESGLREIFEKFRQEYLYTDEGREHRLQYEREMEEVVGIFEEIKKRSRRGEDLTDLILHHLLPLKRETVFRSGYKSLQAFYSRSGKVLTDEDLFKIARAVLSLIRELVEHPTDPEKQKDAIASFVRSPYSRGIQAGTLSPVLHYLEPTYLAVNERVINATLYISREFMGREVRLSSRLEDYLESNQKLKTFLRELADVIPELSDYHLFDMFCYWLDRQLMREHAEGEHRRAAPARRSDEVLEGVTIDEVMRNAEEYRRRIVEPSRREFEEAFGDWVKAMKFFFSRVLFQGRRDSISAKVVETVYEAIDEVMRGREEITPHQLKELLEPELEARIGKGKVGKKNDIVLVIDTLKFLNDEAGKDEWNLLGYSVRIMKSEGPQCLYAKLVSGIRGVGPKTSMLFMRDLYFLLEDELKESIQDMRDFEYLQPIDTWVRKVVLKLGLMKCLKGNESDKELVPLDWEIRRTIVEKFGEKSPDFNAGAWLTGYRRKYGASGALYVF